MPMIPLQKMLEVARKHAFAVGYFEAWNQESLEAVLQAAEETGSPVILGFGGMMVDQAWFDRWGLDHFAAMGRAAVERSKVPVCLILNETKELSHCLRGIGLGFNVVMLDSSLLPFEENLAVTRRLVDAAHPKGVAVEAELGHLPEAGREGRGILTDPVTARRFAEETGIDALAVSIGNIHLGIDTTIRVDFSLLEELGKALRIPLVIHGGSSFPRDALKRSMELGVAKMNVGTILKKAFLDGIRETASRTASATDIQALVGSRKESDLFAEGGRRVKELVKDFMADYRSVGKAAAYL
jgi:ketose-bisphosphate aldolase